MKSFDVYLNGSYFDTIYFPSRKTESQVIQQMCSELKVSPSNISVCGLE